MLAAPLHDPRPSAGCRGELPDRPRPRSVGGDELQVVAGAGGVDRTAPEKQAAKHCLPVACGVRYRARRRLRESRPEPRGQRELHEQQDTLPCLDRLVLGVHVADGATEPHHLARDRIAEQRKVGSLPLALPVDQAATRAEIDAQQLAQLTAWPGRQMTGHLVLDVRRERNSAYLPRTLVSAP